MQRRRTCRGRVAWSCAWGGLYGLAALVVTGCIVDEDNKCGASQVESDVAHVSGCICAPNSVPNASGIGCTPCGDNASAQNGSCICNAGFARVSEGGACVASQLGAPCTTSAQCSPDFPVCATGGYCTTSGCTSSAACAGGYTCDATASPSFCRKPATGQGTTCTMGGNECASFDAKYCALSGAMGACSVSGCAKGTARCDVGYACCDYSAIAGQTDLCVNTTALQGGKCPFIMTDPVVTP